MKVLFNHNVPHKLRHILHKHEVLTADEMGWATLENGDLIRVAETADFEVMITGDKNLSYQQNLRDKKLALIVLSTNNWKVLKQNVAPVLAALNVATPGSFQIVEI